MQSNFYLFNCNSFLTGSIQTFSRFLTQESWCACALSHHAKEVTAGRSSYKLNIEVIAVENSLVPENIAAMRWLAGLSRSNNYHYKLNANHSELCFPFMQIRRRKMYLSDVLQQVMQQHLVAAFSNGACYLYFDVLGHNSIIIKLPWTDVRSKLFGRWMT